MQRNPTRTALTLALALIPAASAAQGGSPVGAPLLGSWLYGRLSPVEYDDRTTDRWMDASGATEIVTFLADGRYERTRLLSLTTYGCTSKLFIFEKGTVKIEGDRLTYRPAEGVNKGYTCQPPNSWKTTTVNPETWTFSFERDASGQDLLVLRGKESELHYGRYRR